MKKYKILKDQRLEWNFRTLYRIQAIKDFSDVKKGDLGGWVESENNLSQEGDCWIYDNASVCDNAWVCDNASVCGNALICGNAKVHGNASVCGNALIYGNAKVHGNAEVFGGSWVYGDAEVFGNAKVHGNAEVFGNAEIRGDAIIQSNEDYIVFKNNWSSGRYFTWTRSNNMWRVGCFYGSGKELIEKAYKDSDLSGKMYEAYVRFVEQLSNINK